MVFVFNVFRGTGLNVTTALSPVGMVAVAYLFCIASVMIPKDAYEAVMHEPNLMAGNGKLLFMYGMSCLAFLAGFFLMGGNSRNQTLTAQYNQRREKQAQTQNRLYHLPPLLVVGVLNLFSMVLIFKNTPGLMGLIMSGDGDVAKQTIDTTGGLAGVQPLLIAMVWWSMGKHMVVFDNLRSPQARVSALAIGGSLLLAVMISVVKVARYEIIPLLVGSLIVFLVMNAGRGKVNGRKLLVVAGIAGVAVIGIFMAFSLLRGNTSEFQMQRTLYGYGPASFNHLVAVLEGRLVFPYAGTGTYSFAWLSNAPFIYKIVNFQALLGLPDTAAVFQSEFDATERSGLARSFNWVTAFGYYYQDWGQWAYLFMAILGAFTCIFWKKAIKGETMGLVLYPFAAGSILLWFAFPVFTRPQLTTYLLAIVALTVYDMLFSQRKRDYLKERMFARGTPQRERTPNREQVPLHPRPQMSQRPRRNYRTDK